MSLARSFQSLEPAEYTENISLLTCFFERKKQVKQSALTGTYYHGCLSICSLFIRFHAQRCGFI